ncbi:MAG: diacylglycerol kinase [Planctomycetota bacterium]
MKHWISKFRYAFAGIAWAFGSQSSFWVHLPVGIAVLCLSLWLRLDPLRCGVLVICIGIVISAELFNSALEALVQKLHPEHDLQIKRALDAGAAAVLVLAIAAVVVGLLLLGPPLWQRLVGGTA